MGIDWTKKETLYFVGECYDRDANLRVLLGYSTHVLDNAIILILGKTIFQPYMSRGWDLEDSDLKSIRIQRNDMPSSAGIWEGKVFSPFFNTLGLDIPDEVALIPIPIGKRLSILILGEPIDGRSLADLRALAKGVGKQLEKLIVLTKSGELPAPEDRIPATPRKRVSSEVSNESLEAHVLEATSEVEEVLSPGASSDNFLDASEAETSFTESEKSHPRLNKKEVEEYVIRQTLTLESEVGLIAPNLDEDLEKSPFRKASEEMSEEEGESSKTSFGLPLLDMSTQIEIDPSEVIHSAESTSFGLPLLMQSSEMHDEPSTLNGDIDSDPTRATLSQIDKSSHDEQRVPTMVSEIIDATKIDLTAIPADATETQTESMLVKPYEKGFSRDEHTSGVSIMIPKQIGEENVSNATLMGGIGVAADLVEKSLRETVANPAIRSGDFKRNIPGAAIFRARKKSGKVGDFIPRSTKQSPALPHEEATKVHTQKFENVKESANENPTRETQRVIPSASKPLPHREEEKAKTESEGLQTDTNPNIPPKIQREMKVLAQEKAQQDDWNLKADPLDPSMFDGLSDPSQLSIEAQSIILESGPSVLENQEYFLMIDSRNKKVAFNAAQKIAEIGEPALPFLTSIFPGRIFIDRYQYTAETLPNAALHTPVLECLTQIGQSAMGVPFEYLEDKSTETRFYAIFALLNFDCGDRLGEIYERFFDKDPQIQQVAKFVLRKSKGNKGFVNVIDRLRNEIQFSAKDHRLEIACQLLSAIKDRQSVELLINLLEERSGHTKTTIHRSLQNLTLKDLSSPYEWRQWWKEAHEEPRSTWLVAALDSNDEMIRKSAYDEIQHIPGLTLNYHALQPSKLRRRAQRELRSWFDTHP